MVAKILRRFFEEKKIPILCRMCTLTSLLMFVLALVRVSGEVHVCRWRGACSLLWAEGEDIK